MKNLKTIIITLLAIAFIAQSSYAAGVSFYHTDPSGTPIRMTDETGKVSWLIIYNPFGEQGSLAKMGHNQKRFIGKQHDSETGLLNVGVRYMQEYVGRFTSPDPVGPVDPATGKINDSHLLNPQMLNIYAYGLNNPYTFIDPDGKTPQDRVKWAFDQYNNNKLAWAWHLYNQRSRCNEFVYAAHAKGDPDVGSFPTVLRADKYGDASYPFPIASDLADPGFMPKKLEYLPISSAQPGDIVVWYEKGGAHHTGVYVGKDEVLYQNWKTGVKKNTISGTSEKLGFKGDPIVRRYRYDKNQ